jgi:hypothetical protein
MTDLRKAAEMALKKLERSESELHKARAALRQALAQPEHEPVGWYDSISGLMDFTFYRPVRKPSSPSAEWVPVYAAPTKREWVGLTDEEIWAEGADNVLDVYFARDIEAKLKEKNHG